MEWKISQPILVTVQSQPDMYVAVVPDAIISTMPPAQGNDDSLTDRLTQNVLS